MIFKDWHFRHLHKICHDLISSRHFMERSETYVYLIEELHLLLPFSTLKLLWPHEFQPFFQSFLPSPQNFHPHQRYQDNLAHLLNVFKIKSNWTCFLLLHFLFVLASGPDSA